MKGSPDEGSQLDQAVAYSHFLCWLQRNPWQRRQLPTSERKSQLAPATTRHSGRSLSHTLGGGQVPEDGGQAGGSGSDSRVL